LSAKQCLVYTAVGIPANLVVWLIGLRSYIIDHQCMMLGKQNSLFYLEAPGLDTSSAGGP